MSPFLFTILLKSGVQYYFRLFLHSLVLCTVYHLAWDLCVVLQWTSGLTTNVNIPLESQVSFITCSNSSPQLINLLGCKLIQVHFLFI